MLIKTVDLASITPYANNPRKNDKAVDVVANSITQFGFQQPIVVDKNNVIVFDGFSGSGSTLIACEKTSRKARCIELEPKFVDVTIARWQELTGLQAVNQHGVKWDDITAPINTNEAMEAFFNLPTEVVTYE